LADDDSSKLPEDIKLTRTKRKWAREGKFLTGQVARAETERLPPGQHLVRDWPVLDLGEQPTIALGDWKLVIDGAVQHPTTLDWAQFQSEPQSAKVSDIHCVTTWSRYDNRWAGVATRDILDLVMPASDAQFVILHSHDRYTTNITLDDFASDDAIVAHSWEGAPLAREHGGPVRLIIPHLYFWKSAKWLKRIEFATKDAPGFWEVNGYHNRADPWKEQRYSDD
jgi:DMSO/TMAO reductase YedYZ molybdopterin-dependent catalytic subunit